VLDHVVHVAERPMISSEQNRGDDFLGRAVGRLIACEQFVEPNGFANTGARSVETGLAHVGEHDRISSLSDRLRDAAPHHAGADHAHPTDRQSVCHACGGRQAYTLYIGEPTYRSSWSVATA